MNNTEAKFILSAYRPDGRDAADETFCAALIQAKTDPALARWFELEQSFDRAMCAKLGEIAPPPGLREAILVGGRVSADPAVGRAWWRLPGWVAAAGGAVTLGADEAVARDAGALGRRSASSCFTDIRNFLTSKSSFTRSLLPIATNSTPIPFEAVLRTMPFTGMSPPELGIFIFTFVPSGWTFSVTTKTPPTFTSRPAEISRMPGTCHVTLKSGGGTARL